jgi:hypothetical protein
VNTPPTIESIAPASERAEADQPLQITAVVKDAESAQNQLTYNWSAAPAGGSFSGTGATTTWRPPLGQTTPNVHTITLTVVENYSSAGQAKQNSVSKSTTVHYNDSAAEITALAKQFLTDYGTYSTSGAYCVRNFSDNCRGKQDEREQIDSDRREGQILSAAYDGVPAVFMNDRRDFGSVEGPCTFIDIPFGGENAGRRQRVTGTCVLTGVYEEFRWRLCDSFFREPYGLTLLSLRNPGLRRTVID